MVFCFLADTDETQRMVPRFEGKKEQQKTVPFDDLTIAITNNVTFRSSTVAAHGDKKRSRNEDTRDKSR